MEARGHRECLGELRVGIFVTQCGLRVIKTYIYDICINDCSFVTGV